MRIFLAVSALILTLAVLSIPSYSFADPKEVYVAEGTGFVASSDGYIVTEYHVIQGTKNTIVVLDGKAYAGMVMLTDPADDLAILKISLDHAAPFMNVVIDIPGENVVAFGYDLGNPPLKSHMGKLDSSLDEIGFLGMTPYVCHGDSGGPVTNKNLDVVGVTHAFIGTEKDSCSSPSQASSGEAVLKLLDRVGVQQVPGHKSQLSPVFIQSEII